MNIIQLEKPISIPLKTITLSHVRYVVQDDGQSAVARIGGLGKPMVLWDAKTTPTYAEIGDYTESQIEARMAELLGNDPAAVLTALVSPSQRV